MADPNDALSQLDLQSLPPEQAAALIREHQRALAAQQSHALFGMLSAMPELQEAGKAEYAQGGRERGTTQELGGQVLHQALGETLAKKELAMLQQQIEYQRGQLGLQGQQLGLSILGPLIPHLLNAGINENTIKGLTGVIGGNLGDKLGKVLSTRPEAEKNSVMDILAKVGIDLGGVLNRPTTSAPPGASKKPKKSKAPTGPTHYLVSPDGKARIAADANGQPIPGAVPEPIP